MAEYSTNVFKPVVRRGTGDITSLPIGIDLYNNVFRRVGLEPVSGDFNGMMSGWATEGGTNEAGQPVFVNQPTKAALEKLNGLSFDFTKGGGPGNSGTLMAYNPDGSVAWTEQQRDSSAAGDFLTALALAGGGFGLAGLAGLGPLGGLLGGGAATGEGLASQVFADSSQFLQPLSNTAVAGTASDAGLAAALEAAGSGFTPEALQAWGGSAGAGLGEAASLAGAGGSVPSVFNAAKDSAASGYIGNATAPAGVNLGGLGGAMGTAASFWPTDAKGWANLLAPVASTGAQMLGARSAAGAMQSATADSNALLRDMYNQTRADNLPALTARNDAIGQIQALLKNPGSITADPGYQFGLDEGMKAGQNSAAAKGTLGSGQTLKALTKYGQDYAGTKLNDSVNRLLQVANIGNGAAATIAGSGQNAASQQANNLTGLGSANGAYRMAMGNAFGDAVNQLTAYGNKNWWGG